MLASFDWGRWLQILSVVASSALLVKLSKERLLSKYRYFSAYLFWDLLVVSVLLFISPTRDLYAYVYFPTQAVTWILYVMTALELLTSVLKRYPGIATLGRKIMTVSLSVGIVVALLSMLFGVNYPPNTPAITVFALNLFLLGRIVCISVLGFLLVSSALLAWFPVPLPANAIRFLLGYTLVFAARTIAFLLLNYRGFLIAKIASATVVPVFLACVIYWVIRLNRAGEQTDIVVGPRSDPEHERRLVKQMDAINSRLAQSRK